MSAESHISNLWPEYFQEFPCFSEQVVRPGCHPRKLEHGKRSKKAIVLVHGLTDSPYYLLAIAEYFHQNLGYNVYLPLLQGHGLKHPGGMAQVSLAVWKENVRFALQAAAENSDIVSIGGFSTGGALSVYLAFAEQQVTGEIYLFSAALGIYGGPMALFSGMLEFFLRMPVVRLMRNTRPLTGRHLYRYDRVPLNSAGELSKLILQINKLIFSSGAKIGAKRIFAAWSEYDRVINVRKLSRLQSLTGKDRFVSYVISEEARVEHAWVVLREPIFARNSGPGEAPLELANPFFSEMMAAMHRFNTAC